MYRNTRYPLEVQIRLGKCATWATDSNKPFCVVAVAIAAGRDVFIIDIETPEIGFRLCEDGILHRKIRKFGEKTYEIHLPIGTKIRIEKRSVGDQLDIDINSSYPDKKQCEGICGNFDGDSLNDAFLSTTDPFSVTEQSLAIWRVTTKSANFFNRESENSLSPWENTLKFCDCDEKNIDHALAGNIADTIIHCNPETRSTCFEGSQGGLLRCDLEFA
ncbi:hypothetical protein DPMN_133613 [Dreissena polymorpha]|uniref:VWFD domain-containing protein n=1 Tax=Dreissena polymorpha TaxID=45954 RepID=A0A9D4FUN3_DREPO|nr:hypothetical protein DPMN_133613 [Dreissena polymorpha]